MMHLADGWAQRERDVSMSAGSGLRGMAWLYGYDVERAVWRR
jgi:hypothetical protein